MRLKEGRRHRTAKMKLAKWLRSACAVDEWEIPSGARVFVECPLAMTRDGGIFPWWLEWDDVKSRTAKNIVRQYPWAIIAARFDVAIVHESEYLCAFEVQSLFEVNRSKATLLERMPFMTIEIDADWVLSKVKSPKNWSEGIIGRYGLDQSLPTSEKS